MINLCRFSKMSFTELVSLPNYYIHEIYKLYVEDNIAKAKKEKEEKAKQEAQQRASNRSATRQQDSANVADLRSVLSGLSDDDFENLVDELE